MRPLGKLDKLGICLLKVDQMVRVQGTIIGYLSGSSQIVFYQKTLLRHVMLVTSTI